MPAHYNMIASFSPSVFSHSPPASFDYSVSDRLYDPTHSLFQSSHHLSSVRAATTKPQPLQQIIKHNFISRPIVPSIVRAKMPTAPKRSCLAVRTGDVVDHSSSINGNTNSTNSTKKHVVFADDKGFSLTEIRIMSEPSSVPPLWSLEFLAHVTQGMVSPVPMEQWTVSFRQPASDYLDFRRTLDSKNVSLENVIVKENDALVVGTVKVRNLSFHKEVVVRTSSDGWKTQEDTFCTYSTIGGSNGVYVLYDTFSFKLTLPPVSRKLEFCVCFRTDGTEYWDNNNNENYVINKRFTGCGLSDVAELPSSRSSTNIGSGANSNNTSTSAPITICNPSSKVQSPWSEFASWNYEQTGPYW